LTGEPHCAQNFAISGFSLLHCKQIIVNKRELFLYHLLFFMNSHN
jgi:hypothetical protein